MRVDLTRFCRADKEILQSRARSLHSPKLSTAQWGKLQAHLCLKEPAEHIRKSQYSFTGIPQ
eukprot:1667467-Amphidinium_carterae.1